jgi:hypothetical protein
MSASLLLAYVSAVLSLQVVLAVAFALWKRRRNGAPGRPTPGPVERPRGAWEGWRAFTVARREYEDSAHTVCSFYLEPVDGASLPPFTPGQFLTLAVPMGGEHTRTRCYSLSEGPNASHSRISVKRMLATPGGPERSPGVCSNRLHDALRVGDRVQARPPAGGFVLDPDTTLPSVLIAGGVGITPLLCMLRGGLAADPNRTFHLYYGVRNGAEHSFRNELEDLARRHRTFHLSVVYDQPGPGDVLGESHLYDGNIDVDLLRRTLPAGRHRFYVCGPPLMMANLLPALGQWGVLPEDLNYEAFGPGRLPLQQPAEALEVNFRKSGRTLTWDGSDSNLLDFAERYGLAVESGCRIGRCGACQVKLVSGTVRDDDEAHHGVTPGHCLLCVSAPRTALELDA